MKKLPFEKPKKKRLKSISSLKRKAWKIFSEYIRRRDADENGYNRCVTCPEESSKSHWKLLQASHIVAGRRLGILFDERGVYPACYVCNIHKHGNVLEFLAFLRKKHGRDEADAIIEELKVKSKESVKWSREDFEAVINKYQGLLATLPNGNGGAQDSAKQKNN